MYSVQNTASYRMVATVRTLSEARAIAFLHADADGANYNVQDADGQVLGYYAPTAAPTAPEAASSAVSA